MSAPSHTPVMVERVRRLLAPAIQADGAVLVDCTLGLGGHAAALLAAHGGLRLVGLDRDPQARALAGRRLAAFRDRVDIVPAVYDEIADVLAALGISRVQAVLMDLGVSSLQLDHPERGFSYAQDAALDMRMDPGTGLTAADVLNTYAAADLARVLREYGEERFARRIADAVVRERSREPFTTSARLVALVRDAIPAPARRTGGNPAKRTFQALRIEVNGELDSLARALPTALDVLAVNGRMAVLAYQSLEDRLVKRSFAAGAAVQAPPDLPFVPDDAAPTLRLLTRGAETPGADEVAINPRAASARLRAVERIRDAA